MNGHLSFCSIINSYTKSFSIEMFGESLVSVWTWGQSSLLGPLERLLPF